jgi:hypothetical protein
MFNDNNLASVIDGMVSNSANSASVGPHANTTPDMRFDGETNQVTLMGKAPVATRITDDPSVDPMNEVAQVGATMSRLQAQLDEVDYDRATGEPSQKLTGRERELVEVQLASARNAHHYATVRAAQLFGQREADEQARQHANQEEVARFAFTQGDPARAKALNEAVLRAEADEAARAIVAGRKR